MFSKIFNRGQQARPTVKRVSEMVNLKSHKPKKYISLVFVPSYSGGRTRQLHIPHTMFYGMIFGFIFISALIAGFYLRSIYFEQMSHEVHYALVETQETFEDFQVAAEMTHTYLLSETLSMYQQLNNEQDRARQEARRQAMLHQNNFDGVQMHIDFLEQQLQDFEEERQIMLEFLSERGRVIPPINTTLRQLNASQNRLIANFNYYHPQPAEEEVQVPAGRAAVRLLSATEYDPITEAEIRARIETLSYELELQRQLFESLESYKTRIDTYLSNFPTLMPIDDGIITSWFGNRSDPIHGGTAFHSGVDIPAPAGTPIRAAGGGVVTYSGFRGGYGIVVFIDHGNGISTRYAHNTQNIVREGQRVERGEIIAYVGSTGRSLSPHLHYEVLRGHSQIDPLPFILESYAEYQNR
ncbi:MAG: peptidoglycan DD-metalloendopeptidase family protein [Defluviitaleaceae bacterium]|nr:peptidoglycan DD-metalloendopeptidase family protein [Defluviitaleaceae bacterium]